MVLKGIHILDIRILDSQFNFYCVSYFLKSYLPSKFKMHAIVKFDGTSFPTNHLKLYTKVIQFLGVDEDLMS